MRSAVNLLESLAGIETHDRVPRVLEMAAFVFLALMILFAPHSIAATQTAWLIGMTAWLVRLFFKPRPVITLTAVGLALCALFAWSLISSILSYEPWISLDKLRGASTFLIFVYSVNVIKNRRAVIFLTIALIGSCMIAALSAPVQKLMGRGVEVAGVVAGGPLASVGVADGDTIVRVNGLKISKPEDVVAALDQRQIVRLTLYRPDYEYSVEIAGPMLNQARDPATALGFSSWKPSRKFRAAGFYGHYTTFAEVLQLVGAVTFGLLLTAFATSQRLQKVLLLGLSVCSIALALLLSVTRASQLALMISSMSTVILGASRRFVLVAA
ncbi:MAG: PDZ domain-containing protein, partial [bacterium]|nr:PDZ domain-containing protein [bacterium]